MITMSVHILLLTENLLQLLVLGPKHQKTTGAMHIKMHAKASREVPHGIPKWSYIIFDHSGNEAATKLRTMI